MIVLMMNDLVLARRVLPVALKKKKKTVFHLAVAKVASLDYPPVAFCRILSPHPGSVSPAVLKHLIPL